MFFFYLLNFVSLNILLSFASFTSLLNRFYEFLLKILFISFLFERIELLDYRLLYLLLYLFFLAFYYFNGSKFDKSLIVFPSESIADALAIFLYYEFSSFWLIIWLDLDYEIFLFSSSLIDFFLFFFLPSFSVYFLPSPILFCFLRVLTVSVWARSVIEVATSFFCTFSILTISVCTSASSVNLKRLTYEDGF